MASGRALGVKGQGKVKALGGLAVQGSGRGLDGRGRDDSDYPSRRLLGPEGDVIRGIAGSGQIT